MLPYFRHDIVMPAPLLMPLRRYVIERHADDYADAIAIIDTHADDSFTLTATPLLDIVITPLAADTPLCRLR